MASIGKKFPAKQYWNTESSSSSDDDDSDLVVDDDDVKAEGCANVADANANENENVKGEEIVLTENKKKRKRVSDVMKRYTIDLKDLKSNLLDGDVDTLLTEFIEKWPPSKKRRGMQNNEIKKPTRYNPYQMFCKNNQSQVKNIAPMERMTQLGKMWKLVNQELWKNLANEENLRLDPSYQVKVPKEKKSTNPMLVWMKERLSKMPQYVNMSKKELNKLAMKEIVKDEMIEEYKQS